MGWLKALRNNTLPLHPEQVQSPHDIKVKLEADVQEISHIEDISISSITPHEISQSLPFASLDTPDSELPFFSAAEIQALASNSGPRNELPEDPLYIVVENIVYDCTQFVHDHPGGRQVIESFRGQDCSWQFWRFHSRDVMKEWGFPLRVARTEGVKNRWKERPKFVGLKRLGGAGQDDW